MTSQQEPCFPKYAMSEDTLKNLTKRHGLYALMVFGQQNATLGEFNTFYAPAIRHAVENPVNGDRPLFILGAADGIDSYAATFLAEKLKYKFVVIFDKQGKDGNGAIAKGFGLRNGFENYFQRDAAMIELAIKVIVYLFSGAVGSGTNFNLMRFLEAKVIGSGLLKNDQIAAFLFSFTRIVDRSSAWSSPDWKLDHEKAIAIDDNLFKVLISYVLKNGFVGFEVHEGTCVCGQCPTKNTSASNDSSSSASSSSKKPVSDDNSESTSSQPHGSKDHTPTPMKTKDDKDFAVRYLKTQLSGDDAMAKRLRAYLMSVVVEAARDAETELADKDLVNDDDLPDLVSDDSSDEMDYVD